jgi:HSP20 family protein
MMKGLFPVVTNSDFVFPDTIFDNFFNSFENPTEGNYRVPQVDIEDTDKAYILTTDLPGIAKEDINVSYKKKYIRKERSSHTFCRQFTVRNIQKDGIQAAFKDGVLTVTLPKEDPKKVAEAHRIEVK